LTAGRIPLTGRGCWRNALGPGQLEKSTELLIQKIAKNVADNSPKRYRAEQFRSFLALSPHLERLFFG
jgi:hypothetical protein